MDRVYMMELVQSFQCHEMDEAEFLQRATTGLNSLDAAQQLLAACYPLPADPPRAVVVARLGRAAGGSPAVGQGLVTETVRFGPDQSLAGYLARPADGGNYPPVVVIQEWWGVNDHIRDVARRFAHEGYVTLAPDLYHGVIVSEPDEARKMVMRLDMQQAISEIRAAIDSLLAQNYTKGDRAGIVGFCMGGGLALQTGVAEPRLGAVASFYGRPLTTQQAPALKAPLLALYGAEDRSNPIETVRGMADALTAAKIEYEVHVYPDAGHAFFNDTEHSYEPKAAEDAWQRTLNWFRRHLG